LGSWIGEAEAASNYKAGGSGSLWNGQWPIVSIHGSAGLSAGAFHEAGLSRFDPLPGFVVRQQ
jgi:hypothetical protein